MAPTPPPPSFGALLRAWRFAGALTQEALAERAGVSPRTIQALERGETRPQRDTAARLAAALDLSADQLAAFRAAAAPPPRWRATARPARGQALASESGELHHNLPAELTSFIGRERELAELAAVLPAARLLTLAGGGGIGKTRLALRAAAAALPALPDGAWFVDLAPLANGALVAQAARAALGARWGSGRAPQAALIDHLRPRTLLLLLDNCEHLLNAVARLAEAVLRGCPGVRILATSREPLGVEGEAVYRVPSLSLPDPARPADAAAARASEAVQLFAARAALVQPDFAITMTNAAAVVAICRRLDGIPLAIELAAAQTRVLAPAQLLARLDDRFRLLVGGHGAARRQQTLRAAIDWSYDLLSEPERRVFRRLAVFAGGWTLEAAEVVASGDDLPADDVLDLLTALVDQSLVHAETRGAAARYRLSETIRGYGEEALAAAGEAAATRDRFLRCLVERAEREGVGIDLGAIYGASQGWAAPEQANLLAALDWAEQGARRGGAAVDDGLRLALCLALDGHAPLAEAIGRLRRLLGRSDIPPAPGPAAVLRGTALARLAHLLSMAGDADARPTAARAVAALRAAGDGAALCYGLFAEAQAAINEGDAAGALAAADEAAAAARAAGSRHQLGLALYARSSAAFGAGDIAGASAAAAASVDSFRAGGEAYALAAALGNVGFIDEEEGHPAAARRAFAAALALAAAAEYPNHGARCLAGLAGVAFMEGDRERAVRLFAAADAARDVRGARLLRPIRRLVDAQLATVRARLAPAVFAAAWERGRALSLESAVAEALEPSAGAVSAAAPTEAT